MKDKNYQKGNCRYLITIVVCIVTLSLPFSFTSAFADSPHPSLASQETLRLGERMYREGILPSGKPMLTQVQGEHSVPGTTYACVSCHLRSGLGAQDENVYTPPATGRKLFQPYIAAIQGVVLDAKLSKVPPLRPAYTDATLMVAIRSGKDPNGRILSEVMPRYILDDGDAMVLINYLKSLSSQFSPGVTDTTLRFATVIADDVSSQERDAMLSSFGSYFKSLNDQVKYLKRMNDGVRVFKGTDGQVKFTSSRGDMARSMLEKMSGPRDRNMNLSQWVLKGPPDTWRGQLEEYNRKEPVFALVGGITNGEWKPIHQFSEDNKIPCLFPNTDFPVISDTDWYTEYLSKGYYQEGEGAARYLNSRDDLLKGKAIVQIVRASRKGQALASGFEQTWRDQGRMAPVTVMLPQGKILSEALLTKSLSKKKSAVLIIWDDSTALPALESLFKKKSRPAMVFVSSRYLGESIWTLKEDMRDFTYITYPFSFSSYFPKIMAAQRTQGDSQKGQSDIQKTLRQSDVPLKDNTQKIASLTDALTRLLNFILLDMKGDYYRDNFLDITGTMMDQPYPLYGRVGFGAGRRYASRGCYIVQLSKGDKPELIKKSDWEIH